MDVFAKIMINQINKFRTCTHIWFTGKFHSTRIIFKRFTAQCVHGIRYILKTHFSLIPFNNSITGVMLSHVRTETKQYILLQSYLGLLSFVVLIPKAPDILWRLKYIRSLILLSRRFSLYRIRGRRIAGTLILKVCVQ